MEPTIIQGDIPYEMIFRKNTETFAKTLATTKTKKTILICWESSRIVDIVNILGASVSAWGLYPENDKDDKDCYDATWVCDISISSITLTVYKQFDIIQGKPFYSQPRNQIVFQKTYNRNSNQTLCTVM